MHEVTCIVLPPAGKDVEEEDKDKEKTEEEMNEEEKIAELGKPRLGDISKITCHIRESMEFKVFFIN